jgi:hypothetical protein
MGRDDGGLDHDEAIPPLVALTLVIISVLAALTMFVNYGIRESPVVVEEVTGFRGLLYGLGGAGLFYGMWVLIQRLHGNGSLTSMAVAGCIFGLLLGSFVGDPRYDAWFLSPVLAQVLLLIIALAVVTILALPRVLRTGLAVFGVGPWLRPFALIGVPIVCVMVAGSILISMRLSNPSWFENGATNRQVGLLPLWHVVDVVPLVDVNETLSWRQPVTTSSKAVQWIILGVKLAFVLTVVEFVKTFVTALQKGEPPSVSDDAD